MAQGDLTEGHEREETLLTTIFAFFHIHFYQTRFYLVMHLPLFVLFISKKFKIKFEPS